MDIKYSYRPENDIEPTPAPALERESTSAQRSASGLSRIGFSLFLASIFALPFMFLPIVGWEVATGKVIVAALLLLSGGIMFFGGNGAATASLPRTYTFFLLGMVLLVFLSTLLSLSPTQSFFGLSLGVGTFYTFAIACMYGILAPLFLNSSAKLVSTIMAFIGGGLVLFAFHLLRALFGAGLFSFGYFTSGTSSPVGSWNDLGIFFAVTYLVTLVISIFSRAPRKTKLILKIVSFVSLFLVILVNFHTLNIFLVILSLGIAVFSFTSKKDTLAFAATLILLPVVFFNIYANTTQTPTVIGAVSEQIFGAAPTEVRPKFSSSMTQAGLSSAKSVLVGSGPGTFQYLWQQERPQEVINSDLWSVDFPFSVGIIPTFLTTHGVLATLLMLAFAGYLGYLLVRHMRNQSGDPTTYAVMLSSGLAAILLWSFSIFYVFGPTIFLLMLLFSGIFIASISLHTQSLRVLNISGPQGGLVTIGSMFVMVALLVPAGILATSKTLYGQALVEARTAVDVEGIRSAQRKLNTASGLEGSDLYARVESELVLVKIQDFLVTMSANAEQIAPEEQEELELLANEVMEAANRATRLGRNNYLNFLSQGYVYEALGVLGFGSGFERSASSYAQAQVLNPTNPELRLIQARLEIAREDYTEARRFAELALQIKPNFVNARVLLADVELIQENNAAAAEELLHALEILPRNTTLNYQLGLIYYADGNYTGAINAFSNVISVDAQNANARYFRALAYVYGEDNTENALRDLRVVEENNPDNELVLQVIENIEAGEDPLSGITADVTEGVVEDDSEISTSNRESIDALTSEEGVPSLGEGEDEDIEEELEEEILE